ncbi:hypothetical protein HYV73_02700 [Candidatus Uhrbacteria bacterium]|nr:hypothetical protein [Candidatus Uhrbacteria bacterium]
MKVFYSGAYVRPSYAFDTTRKAKWVADSLVAHPIDGVELQEPRAVTAEELADIHDRGYVEAIRTGVPDDLARSQGFMKWNPGVWDAVCAMSGGVVEAVHTAIKEGASGSLSSGLHHARRDSGAGFCTFNGLALGAKAAIKAGVRKVLILDLDAHGGRGTHSIVNLWREVTQLDISVCDFDTAYKPALPGRVVLVRKSQEYQRTIEAYLNVMERNGPFGVCLYNAGMDPFEGSAEGGLEGITAAILRAREQFVFSWCRRTKTPVAFVLAGGYTGPSCTKDELVDLHRLTIEAAANIR